MNKKLLVILPLIGMALTGCSSGGNADKDLLEKAMDSLPMLIDFSSGKEVNATSTAIAADDYDSYLGLNTLYWKETQFELNWTCAPENKWSVKSYAADSSRTKFMPLYGDEVFDCSLTLAISIEGKSSTVTRTWNFSAATHDSPDLTDYSYYSIETIEKDFVKDSNAHSSEKVYTYGTIVAAMEQSETHVYSGVYIQDGAYGLMLYAGNLKTLWFSVGFAIGDTVMIAGTASPYNGLMEVKPTYIEYADSYLAKEGAPTVADPVTTDITDLDWNYANVGIYQSALVRLNGLTFSSVKTALKIGVHGELVFKKGDTDVNCYVNYHIGEDTYNGLIEEAAGWTAGETVVDFYGIISVYNNPQIFPVFGADSFTPTAA